MCDLGIMKEPYPDYPTCGTCKHMEDIDGWIDSCEKGPYKRCPVSGSLIYHSCSTMRSIGAPCGPEGKLYEPHIVTSLVDRLIALFK